MKMMRFIAFPDNLLKDQTYIVTVNRNLKDERKSCLRKNDSDAFSTGDVIEEGKISGRVYGNEKYAAHLWRANTVFDDSLYLTKPLYVSEADDNGFLHSAICRLVTTVMAVERSASGLPIVPSRMMYGMVLRNPTTLFLTMLLKIYLLWRSVKHLP